MAVAARDAGFQPHNLPPRTPAPSAELIQRATIQAPTTLSSWQAQPASIRTPVFWPADAARNGVRSQAAAGEETRVSPASFVTELNSETAAPPQKADLSPPDDEKLAAEVQRAMESVQQRLQALGAVHYRLETAGPRGEQYYFRCTAALPSNPNYHRYFEATEGDPLRAMEQVLAQIEAWRSGR
jgi:hypothetical protein